MLLWLLATKSTKYIGEKKKTNKKKKQEISTEENALVRRLLITGQLSSL